MRTSSFNSHASKKIQYSKIEMITAGLPQLKEICFKKTITLGGGSILIAYIRQSFQKSFVSLFQIPTPYKGSPMQISCGSPG